MISVCHVQVLPILSGVQRAMLDIFGQLDRSRYELHVACQGEGPLTAELRRRNIQVHLVPWLRRPIRPWSDWKALHELQSLFERNAFHIVHTHSSKPGILGRLAAHRAGIPWIVHHVHGFAFHQFTNRAKRSAYGRLEKWAGSYCDRVVFVNDEERQMAIQRGWLRADQCMTVYNGVELPNLESSALVTERRRIRERLSIAPEAVVVLFLGRLDVQKQPLILPEIAARLCARQTTAAWHFLIAGDGPLRSSLAKRAQVLGVQRHLQILGWHDKPQELTRVADIMILPSLYEGLPLSLLEAHAHAIPSVASNAKGNREVVRPGTGYLCSIRDPEDYARSLQSLINDQQTRKSMGQAARRLAERQFNVTANARQIGDLYDSLLGHVPAQRLRRAA